MKYSILIVVRAIWAKPSTQHCWLFFATFAHMFNLSICPNWMLPASTWKLLTEPCCWKHWSNWQILDFEGWFFKYNSTTLIYCVAVNFSMIYYRSEDVLTIYPHFRLHNKICKKRKGKINNQKLLLFKPSWLMSQCILYMHRERPEKKNVLYFFYTTVAIILQSDINRWNVICDSSVQQISNNPTTAFFTRNNIFLCLEGMLFFTRNNI